MTHELTASRLASASSKATASGGWWRDAVIYQVYVRSFADSDGDGIGDLRGVRAPAPSGPARGRRRLAHPFYLSPQADGGYDVADYRAVDPLFGDLSDADELVRGAHALGLRVIVDVVPNHTSDRHAWFGRPSPPPPATPPGTGTTSAPAEEPPASCRPTTGSPSSAAPPGPGPRTVRGTYTCSRPRSPT